ncbi:CBO0543 family protein [Alteribacillus bidgolensis]|uniref:Uncharacterized protein n=1 Tax=Alteribacillus bidgolensis TaxID=930129 RepID=A0A1G8JGE1_9BACI|nr:CBO0543 family protein [Alteribacillus bidgolensis]SDI30349.1 hypothetical protein SAMN05216352_106191 [Alteribacillus bidgolensis]
MNNNQYPSWDEIVNLREEFRDSYWAYWINENLFSFGWFLQFGLNILFIYIAYKLLDRTRLFELLTAGGIIAILSSLLDSITIQNVLTTYPNSFTPISPPFVTSTVVILPIVYMLLYQFFSTWQSFIIANVISGAILAFVIENLFRWLDIYQYIQWNSFFSFIVYLVMAVILKWIMNYLMKAQK